LYLFINDIPVTLHAATQPIQLADFNHVVNANKEAITRSKLINRVLILNAREDHLDSLLDLLESTTLHGLISLTVLVEDYAGFNEFLKKKYKVMTAAGGLVTRKDKILMIYRLKKWDLPKGKIDKGEKAKEAAVREIQEECGVQSQIVTKLCTTWHTYTLKKKRILKKTTWYEMTSVGNGKLTPQEEEGIDEARWMSPKEVHHALEDSYKSISLVFDFFHKKRKKAKVKN
jgi:ADP-ribose pyrophosphatase YjhB (NUDIX family)